MFGNELIGRMRGYQAYFGFAGSGFPIPFRDRESEALGLLSQLRGVSIVYGPLGCGKTTFLRAFLDSLGALINDLVIVYVNFEEREFSNAVRVVAPGLVGDSLGSLLRAVFDLINPVLTSVRVDVIVNIGRLFGSIVNAVRGAWLRERRLVLVFDELDKKYREMTNTPEGMAISYGQLDKEVLTYAGMLENNPETVLRHVKDLAVIFSFSDQAASRVAMNYSGKGGLVAMLLWNLPKDAFAEVIHDVFLRIGSTPNLEVLWQLFGGNVRALSALVMRYNVNVNAWLEGEVIAKVRSVLAQVGSRQAKTPGELISQLNEASPDLVYTQAGGDDWVFNNVLMGTYGYRLSALPNEPWVGGTFAYQLPAYYWALSAMINLGRVNISGNDVINHVNSYLKA